MSSKRRLLTAINGDRFAVGFLSESQKQIRKLRTMPTMPYEYEYTLSFLVNDLASSRMFESVAHQYPKYFLLSFEKMHEVSIGDETDLVATIFFHIEKENKTYKFRAGIEVPISIADSVHLKEFKFILEEIPVYSIQLEKR